MRKWHSVVEEGPKHRFTDFTPKQLPCNAFSVSIIVESLKKSAGLISSSIRLHPNDKLTEVAQCLFIMRSKVIDWWGMWILLLRDTEENSESRNNVVRTEPGIMRNFLSRRMRYWWERKQVGEALGRHRSKEKMELRNGSMPARRLELWKFSQSQRIGQGRKDER